MDDLEVGAVSEAPAPRRGRLHPLVRIAIVLGALAVVWGLSSLVLDGAPAPSPTSTVSRLADALLRGAAGVALIVLACRMLDRRRLAALGFGWSRSDRIALCAGVGLWLGLAAVGTAVGVVSGWFGVQLVVPTAALLLDAVVHAILVLCSEALPEELAFRGYVYTNLADLFPRWLAVVGQAVLFTAWPLALFGVLRLAGVQPNWSFNLERVVLFLTMGVTLALVRLWTGSLWGSVGLHWAFQMTIQLLSIDRLPVMRVPAADVGNASIVLWFFGIVLAGVIAGIGSARSRGRRAGRNETASA
jgi:hypothetical protein